MKIRMITTLATPKGVFSAGQEYEFSDEVAHRLIAQRSAVRVDSSTPSVIVDAEVAAKDLGLVERRGRRSKVE